MTSKQVFPSNFVLGLQEDIHQELGQIFEAVGLPNEIRQSMENAQYLQLLVDADPENFRPDGAKGHERELIEAVITGANLLQSLIEFREEKVKELYAQREREKLTA